MTDALLTIEALTRRHGANTILRDVDLRIAREEFVILIGGSGSGKTTLLRTVGGLDRADAGRMTLRGDVVDDPSARRFVPPDKRRLGMVFQDYALWPHMTCLENVAAALPQRGQKRAAQDLLDELGVGALSGRKPGQLSGGQQQRVGLARALAAASDLLLLDEPLSSLDVDVRDRMRTRILSSVRQHGSAALFVSHDPVDAWRLADRIVVLEHGRIVQSATPQMLYRDPMTPRIARFTDAVGGLKLQDFRRIGAQAAFAWGDAMQQARAGAGLVEGEPARAYIRPCGVATASKGEPATLIRATFEAGIWRANWHVPAHDWVLCSHESASPAAQTRLALNQHHIFVYPEGD